MIDTQRRLLIAASLALAVVVPARARGQTCTLLPPAKFNDSAFASGLTYRLTDARGSEVGSAFVTSPATITAQTSLHAHFRFEIGPNTTGGDGLAFILQSAAAGAAAIGSGQDSLGYATAVAPSVVIKFDTSSGVQSTNYVALMLGGSTTPTTATLPVSPLDVPLAGVGMLYGWVDYDATTQTLSTYLRQTATKPSTPLFTYSPLDLYTQLGSTGKMYVGFSAATPTLVTTSDAGTHYNQHDVYELEFSTLGVPCACEGDSACANPTPACGQLGLCTACSSTNDTYCATTDAPVCRATDNTCVGCLADSDCSGATPTCDQGSLTCRACSSSADCSLPTPDCASAGANAGKCVTCLRNSECPVTLPRCSPATDRCVQCLTAVDCGGDAPICNSAGVCEPCGTDADCGGTTPACEVWGACGQCSSGNEAACAASTSGADGGIDGGGDGGKQRICDYPSGTCVTCEVDADCSGGTPRCDATSHTCQPCATNADCVGNLDGPACATTGIRDGWCVVCTLDSDCTNPEARYCDTGSNQCVNCVVDADCPSATPKCSSAETCVGCITSADCTSTSSSTPKPVCDPSDAQCKACQNDYSATNPGPLPCSTPGMPACQPASSPLAGECLVCSSVNDGACATLQATPVCITASATCGCARDTDCQPDEYCDTAATSTGVCTAGCRVLDGGVDNCSTGKYCSASGGAVGQCTSEPCNSNADCTTALPVCDTIEQPHRCVQCLNASDCSNSKVCDSSRRCVECTTSQTKNCTASGAGAVCLASETCGCAADKDCGGATSGRVCSPSSHACEPGCRGTGGNGCGSLLVCTSQDGTIGQCVTASQDASTSRDAAPDTGADATTVTRDGGQGHVVTQSVGSGCAAAPSPGTDFVPPLSVLGLALALVVRRRRSA